MPGYATFTVEDASRVAEVRRAALAIAREEGLDASQSGNIAVVATEICTNLLKHARQGEVFLTPLSDRGAPGVELLSIDHGPGMGDVRQCLVDGYSTGESPGTGLGAISRLSQEFDIYTERDKGTVLVAQIGGAKPGSSSGSSTMSIGAVVKPVAGETFCGDAWAFRQSGDVLAIIVADGLGHGMDASRASAEAIASFRGAADVLPLPVLQRVHGALRSTRGAAVAVAHIETAQRRIRYSGIGNISGVVSQAGKASFMVSHSGTAGFHTPRLQEFSYSLPDGGIVIMHSDGLTTSWKLDTYPGLRRCHPSVIAGVLYRDASRLRDDVCVVVTKPGGGL